MRLKGALGPGSGTRNVKLTVEYDGTAFAGWQRLKGRPTVQAALERAVEKVTGERVTLIGAGRTDAGVHALAQVANFKTGSRLANQRIPPALNAHLPATIRVLAAEDVDAAFHARYAAVGRTYRYAVLNRSSPSAILRNHAYHVPYPLDLDAMVEAAEALEGTHVFAAFRGVGSGERTTICTLRKTAIARSGDMVIFTLEADRFLRHMVRMIVGTLLRVGAGKVAPDMMAQILAGEDNQRAGPTMPAHGLYLVAVTYPSDATSAPSQGGED